MRTYRWYLAPLFAAVVVAAACAGGSNPLEPQGAVQPDIPMVSASKGPGGKKLAACKPLHKESTTATFGIMGGTIKVGPHTLFIPPGALLRPTTITASIADKDNTNSVQFAPEGLQFVVPALITLSYHNCPKPSLLTLMSVVYTTNDLLNILELLPSLDNPRNETALGVVSHFSRYAIAF